MSVSFTPSVSPVRSEASYGLPQKEDSIGQLSGCKNVACKVTLLIPKLLLSGAGWAIGFALGGPVGAALGDAIGTFLGCMISLLIEYAIRVSLGEDVSFGEHMLKGAKSALILSAGSAVCGGFFALSLKAALAIVGKHATLAIKAGPAALSGVFCGTAFLIGMTTARFLYSAQGGKKEEYMLSRDNFLKDLKLSFTVILAAEMGFCATSIPFMGHQFLTDARKVSLQNVGSSAATVAIGGTIGLAPHELVDLRQRTVEKLEDVA